MGHSLFTSDTPYILPGWSADKDENLEAGGYCILVSTMNLALNHARAQHWSAGNVSMAIDHTYKVILECVLAIQVSSLCVTYTRSVLRWTLMVILTSASTSLLLTKALTGLSTCGGIWSNGRVGRERMEVFRGCAPYMVCPPSPTSRLAFGMVSHANEKQTTYALDIVLQHCRHVFDFHRHHNLNI